MIIRKATPRDYNEIRAFYHSVIDIMHGIEFDPAWEKDVYPSVEFLHTSLENGEMYVGQENGKIMAAMSVNNESNEGYLSVDWPVQLDFTQYYTVHALGVHPDYAGHGLGKQLVQYAVQLAKQNGMQAVRLDVLANNTPRLKMYQTVGFNVVARQTMFYEDTGWTEFVLFDYPIK